MSGFLLRGELRLKNARLVARREELGMNQKKFSEYIGISYVEYNGYETLRSYPTPKRRALLAAECDCTEATLFPPQLGDYVKGDSPRVIVSTAEVDPARLLGSVRREVLLLPAPSTPESEVMSEEIKDVIRKAINKLRPRDQRVLTLYYGLDGTDPQRYQEIADREGVSMGRVTQIAERALRRLRPFLQELDVSGYNKESALRRDKWDAIYSAREERRSKEIRALQETT